MQKQVFLALGAAVIFASGCQTLSKAGAQVEIAEITTNVQDVEEAEAKLKAEGCEFIQNVEAPIAAGSADESYRLAIGLKNKTAAVGGNVVISSMKANFGMPIFTKGMVYKCKRSMKSNDV